jgi:hypothetical protein
MIGLLVRVCWCEVAAAPAGAPFTGANSSKKAGWIKSHAVQTPPRDRYSHRMKKTPGGVASEGLHGLFHAGKTASSITPGSAIGFKTFF